MPSYKKLRLADPARKDLVEIGKYTWQTWGAAQKRKYLGQIKNAFKIIKDRPEIGPPRDDIDIGLRSHPVNRHIIYYRIGEKELIIVRVLHQSMDWAVVARQSQNG